MISPTRISHFGRSIAAGLFALAILISGANVSAQQDTDGGAGAGDGPLFQATEPDLSVFSGIERGDSIGTSSSQGFGIAADSGGAAAGGRGGAGGGGGLGGLFGGLGGAFGGQGAASQRPIIRVRLRSAIDVPRRPAKQVEQSVIHSLDILPRRNGLENVGVKMDGRTAILFGTVRDAKHRRMGELMLRLEPGVDRVDNRLTIAN